MRRRFCHCGAFSAVTEPDGSTITPGCRGVSAMTTRDGINRLPNAGTIPYGKTDWPWTVGHELGDTSPTALTTG